MKKILFFLILIFTCQNIVFGNIFFDGLEYEKNNLDDKKHLIF